MTSHERPGIAAAAAELHALLDEHVDDARARERRAFDDASPDGAPLVLVGAGGLGRRTLAGLRRAGREPLAFVDNNPANWHTRVDGVEVLSPDEAAARYRDRATFVVTIWRAGGPHRYEHTRRQFEALGCRVVSFATLYWKYADALLPFYCQELPHRVLEESHRVRAAFDLLADDASRQEYVAQVRWRLRADFDGLPHPEPGPQYLADDLFTFRDDEVFVDCGAYDGDTVRALLARPRASFAQVVALEPDPTNFRTLTATVDALPPDVRRRFRVLPLAAASAPGTLYIDASGTAASATSADARPGAVAVDCVRLDDLLADTSTTFLKMDIEGAEPDALAGAAALVARDRPVLAVCVYHLQDHLWNLPLQMHALAHDYRFYLRPYNEEGWDLVCYGVPTERVLQAGQAGPTAPRAAGAAGR